MRRTSRILLTLLAGLGFGCQVSPSNEDPTPAPPIRILAYNIKHGRGMDGKVDLARIASVIRAQMPDVVTLQEIDKGCSRSGGVDEAVRLGELCAMHSAFGKFMDYGGGEYGMAILSRYPISEVENHMLPPGREPRSALSARVDPPTGPPFRLVGIHLYFTEEERLAQARTLVELFAEDPLPVILAGDFNSRPGSKVMELLERSWKNPDKGEDRFTFPSDRPDREIDFVLYQPADRFRVREVNVIDEPVASDHRPLLLVLEAAE